MNGNDRIELNEEMLDYCRQDVHLTHTLHTTLDRHIRRRRIMRIVGMTILAAGTVLALVVVCLFLYLCGL